MRAARIHGYGPPEVLVVEDAPDPTPRPYEVRVRVCATAVNPVDWKIRSGGQRSVIWLDFPWILGLDLSGVVDAVGAKVTRWKIGDEVWASPTHRRPGTYAELTCVHERELARKPARLSHDEAASLPLVALTAYQCLVEKGRLRAGQTVLVHAGAGGVGSVAIQIAKHLGARVITTASARNADFVRGLGADEVIDYTQQRFEDVAKDVDLVIDTLGESGLAKNLAVTRRGGRIANITLDLPGYVKRYGALLGLVATVWAIVWLHVWPLARKGVRLRHVIKRCDGDQLAELARLVDAGAIKPVIDRVVPLAEIADAHRHSETNRARGKIVVHVADA